MRQHDEASDHNVQLLEDTHIMAETIIPGADGPLLHRPDLDADDMLALAQRLLHLIGWIERARVLSDDVRSAASMSLEVGRALQQLNVATNDAVMDEWASAGLRELVSQVGHIIGTARDQLAEVNHGA